MTDMRFRIMPVLTIWGMVMLPLLKTMALGGVATGSMKAQEAAMAATPMITTGSALSTDARAPMMGMRSVVDAVLEVISVRKVTRRTMDAMTAARGSPASPESCSPIHRLSSDLVKAAARENPPPKRRTIPHGSFTAVFSAHRDDEKERGSDE